VGVLGCWGVGKSTFCTVVKLTPLLPYVFTPVLPHSLTPLLPYPRRKLSTYIE
jgi:hypothetical protein